MKKILSLIFALSLCLSLCACQENQVSDDREASKEEKLYERYKDIIDHLEDKDYDGAIEAIEDMADNAEQIVIPAPTQATGLNPDYELSPDPTGPTGPAQTAIYINNAQELFAIDSNSGATYVLARNIDLTGWEKSIEYFSGTLDGNGMVLSNATQPLIKENNGTVKNLFMKDCNLQSNNNAAAVVVVNYGTVSGCTVSGTVSVANLDPHAAGVVCYNYGTVEACTNNATVCSQSYQINELGNAVHGTWAYAGGVIADNCGNVSRCVNHGAVDTQGATSFAHAGGISACNSAGGEITNCYNTGTITGSCDFSVDRGGIAGYNGSGKIRYCYNIGTAYSGIADDNRDYIIDCYYLDAASTYGCGDQNPEGVRLFSFSKGQLTKESTFPTFDFETVWIMTENGPQFR